MIRIEIESGRFISSVNNARRWDSDFSRLFRPVIEFSRTDRERKREKYMKRERERHKTIYVMLHNIGRDVSVWYTESERERERGRESVPNRANRQTNNFSSRKCLRTWIGKLH